MRILVLRGDGLNCERESAAAFTQLGAKVETLHVRALLREPQRLLNSQALVLPGGFSFGDELQSGHILGLSLKHALEEIWPTFIQRRGVVLGVCNGFQTLMKMGVFEATRSLALVHNNPVGFQNRWVKLNVHDSHCIWTRGLAGKVLDQPIRHGEGRVWSQTKTLEELRSQVVMTYTEDVNGSLGRIAALTDSTGQILGLMPHPEAALLTALYPESLNPVTHLHNLKIFSNAMNFIQEANLAVAN